MALPQSSCRWKSRKIEAQFQTNSGSGLWPLAYLATGEFDVVQVRYDLIYQEAATNLLTDALQACIGVAVMRPITSGIMQRTAEYLAPG